MDGKGGLESSLCAHFLQSRLRGILGFNQAHLSIPQHCCTIMMDSLEQHLEKKGKNTLFLEGTESKTVQECMQHFL